MKITKIINQLINNRTSILIMTISFIFSCVPSRKYEELKTKYQDCSDKLVKSQKDNKTLLTENTEFTNIISSEQDKNFQLQKEIQKKTIEYKEREEQYIKLKQLHDEIQKRYDKLLESTTSNSSNLNNELSRSRSELNNKEIELSKLSTDLKIMQADIENKKKLIEDREKKIIELENLVAQKDLQSQTLKNKLSTALMAFDGKGLIVSQKNGKVYVSFDEKLLFPKGSTVINSEGRKAIIQLANSIESEKDIEIIIEGHTDSDLLKSQSYPKNNWELSVLRATSVISILEENKNLNMKNIIASGRSSYNPISDDKNENRRIEVILTPKFEELYNILNN